MLQYNRLSFPDAKADQLNHHLKPSIEEYKYNTTIIHVWINDILWSKGENKVNDIPRTFMNITDACRNYNIPNIFISSVITCSRTTVDIGYINPLCAMDVYIRPYVPLPATTLCLFQQPYTYIYVKDMFGTQPHSFTCSNQGRIYTTHICCTSNQGRIYTFWVWLFSFICGGSCG